MRWVVETISRLAATPPLLDWTRRRDDDSPVRLGDSAVENCFFLCSAIALQMESSASYDRFRDVRTDGAAEM